MKYTVNRCFRSRTDFSCFAGLLVPVMLCIVLSVNLFSLKADYFHIEISEPGEPGINKRAAAGSINGKVIEGIIQNSDQEFFLLPFLKRRDEEAQLKAAFIYRFTEYIQWKSVEEAETFNITVLGQSPVTGYLQKLAESKLVLNKKIVVTAVQNVSQAKMPCHMVFQSRESLELLRNIVNSYKGKPTLIVTEEAGDLEKGAHINFVLSDEKIRFEVNLASMKASGLDASAQMLNLATYVKK
jgi:hypothetical protein